MNQIRSMNRHGFTLIEIMIALFIFAIVAVIAATGLSTILHTRSISHEHSKMMEQLHVASAIIEQDLTQITNRAIRDGRGDLTPALIGTNTQITFIRAGFQNPLLLERRSNLQRVEYLIKNNNLIRRTWQVLDQSPDSKPTDQIILNNVSNLRFDYYDIRNKKLTTWSSPVSATPASDDNQTTLTIPLPKAIKMSFTVKELGPLDRLYIIPGGDLA